MENSDHILRNRPVSSTRISQRAIRNSDGERERRILRTPSRDRSRRSVRTERSRSKSIIILPTRRDALNVVPSNSKRSLGHERRTHNVESDSSGEEHEQRLREFLKRDLRNKNGEHERRSNYRDQSRNGRHIGEHEQRMSTTHRLPKGHYDDEHEQRHSRDSRNRERSRSRYTATRSRETLSRHRSASDNLPTSKSFDHNENAIIFTQFIEALKSVSKGSHSIKSVTNVVPEFDPLSKTQTILSWITKVEECAEIYEWNERETIHYALPKLTGLANSWYQSLPTVKYSWQEWKNKLVESFPCRENYAEILNEMLNLKVKYGEPLEQYYYSKLNLLNRCQIYGTKAVDCILYGIEDRGIKLGAQSASYERPEQVLKYFKSVKVGQLKENTGNRNRSDPKPLPSNGSQLNNNIKPYPANSKPPIKCFNCGIDGHPSFKCPKPLEKCSNCHRLGHRTTTCPSMGRAMPFETEKDKKGSEIGA